MRFYVFVVGFLYDLTAFGGKDDEKTYNNIECIPKSDRMQSGLHECMKELVDMIHDSRSIRSYE